MSGEKHLPQVKEMAQAGKGAVILTLGSGEIVTLTANSGTCMHPGGVLVSDYKNSGSIYFIPSPHQLWQAKVWLGLYGGEQDSDEARFDTHLMALGSITEVDWTSDVLTLAYLNAQGQRRFVQSTGKVTVDFVDAADIPCDQFTRYPIRVAVQEKKEDFEYVTNFRVDHTPEGYAVLKALGWEASLPNLEERR